jgi:chromosomal replication initiator protein
LVTRFESGLLCDLKNPDFETRVAILRKKAEPENIILTDEVFSFIAESITSSVRALEGSLIRILAYASYNNLNSEDLDVDTVRSILSDMISEQHKEITLDTITKEVCLAYSITMTQIMDKTRRQQISYPRQIAMYLANLLIPQLSLKEIAEYFKRRPYDSYSC